MSPVEDENDNATTTATRARKHASMTKPNFNREQLNKLLDRVDRVQAEIKELNNDKKEIFAEAKALGFNTKIMRIVLRRRAMDKAELEEQDMLVDLYDTGL